MTPAPLLFDDERIGVVVLVAYFGGVLLAAELWARLGRPRPELPRKLVHVAGGIGCLFFPLLTRSWIPVLVLSAGLSAIFALAHRIGFLPSLHGVQRSGRGAEYYPLAVLAAFVLSQGRLWLYLAAVLTLAVADGFAALIGGRYGTIGYRIEDSRKSVEGSLVFLVIAFLAVHLPVLLLTDLPRAVCVLASLHVAVLVTGLEAIALRGTDNLWVPLGVMYILVKITAQPLEEVIYQNVSLLLIAAGIALASARVPLFQAGASLVVMLYVYGCWALGGWHWALPLFTGFAFLLASGYGIRPAFPGAARIGVRATERAVIPIFCVLLLANTLHQHRTFYGPFLAGNAVVVALTLTRRVLASAPPSRGRRFVALVLAATIATASVTIPPLLVQPAVIGSAPLAVLAIVIAAMLGNAAVDARRTDPAPVWTRLRIALSLAAAAAVWGLQETGVIPPWDPFQRW